MITPRNNPKIGVRSIKIDWLTVLIYLLLVFFGWINIYAAVYNDDGRPFFDLSQRYGMQLLWIGICLFVALSIILIDDKYYHMLSYPFFAFMLLLMIYVALFGNETNGAKSWLSLGGGIKIQPVEFLKIATALALARFISSNEFDIHNSKSIYLILLFIFLPVSIIILQNDTGSALVFFGFFIMLYCEGFGKSLYLIVGMIILLAILSFLIESITMLLVILLICLIINLVTHKNWKETLQYLSAVMLLFICLAMFLPVYVAILTAIGISIPFLIAYAHKHKMNDLYFIVGLFVGSVIFTFFIDFAFDNVLQLHQQKRILDLLGIERDPQGWSYNVIQSKIAIGSGGFSGKGFLNGTQTKFSFVPEQDTDFIFCTVGEEWGFLGSIATIALFGLLIIRLIRMGERQQEAFARTYCYSVASIIIMHFAINICMTIGLFPVVGIPLPFFSYGGSSLLAFTILLFIAIRLDSKQPDSEF